MFAYACNAKVTVHRIYVFVDIVEVLFKHFITQTNLPPTIASDQQIRQRNFTLLTREHT